MFLDSFEMGADEFDIRDRGEDGVDWDIFLAVPGGLVSAVKRGVVPPFRVLEAVNIAEEDEDGNSVAGLLALRGVLDERLLSASVLCAPARGTYVGELLVSRGEISEKFAEAFEALVRREMNAPRRSEEAPAGAHTAHKTTFTGAYERKLPASEAHPLPLIGAVVREGLLPRRLATKEFLSFRGNGKEDSCTVAHAAAEGALARGLSAAEMEEEFGEGFFDLDIQSLLFGATPVAHIHPTACPWRSRPELLDIAGADGYTTAHLLAMAGIPFWRDGSEYEEAFLRRSPVSVLGLPRETKITVRESRFLMSPAELATVHGKISHVDVFELMARNRESSCTRSRGERVLTSEDELDYRALCALIGLLPLDELRMEELSRLFHMSKRPLMIDLLERNARAGESEKEKMQDFFSRKRARFPEAKELWEAARSTLSGNTVLHHAAFYAYACDYTDAELMYRNKREVPVAHVLAQTGIEMKHFTPEVVAARDNTGKTIFHRVSPRRRSDEADAASGRAPKKNTMYEIMDEVLTPELALAEDEFGRVAAVHLLVNDLFPERLMTKEILLSRTVVPYAYHDAEETSLAHVAASATDGMPEKQKRTLLDVLMEPEMLSLRDSNGKTVAHRLAADGMLDISKTPAHILFIKGKHGASVLETAGISENAEWRASAGGGLDADDEYAWEMPALTEKYAHIRLNTPGKPFFGMAVEETRKRKEEMEKRRRTVLRDHDAENEDHE